MSKGVALIGCGRIANRHAHVIEEIDGLYLKAVCDVDANCARAWGVPWTTGMHEMVRQYNPDIISVLTPSGLHARHVVGLASYRIPIIVEKPMALTLPDANRMIDICRGYGTPLFVVKQNRFNVPITQLRKAVDDGKLGRLLSASICVRWCRHPDYYSDWHGTWSMAGGVLANQASHHIDLLQWMMGEPESVFAYESTSMPIEVEDTLVGIIKFRNNAIGTVEVTTTARPHNVEGSITVIGEKGIVKVGGFACNELEVWQIEGEPTMNPDTYSENPPDEYGFGHRAYYEHVLDCLDNGKEPLVDGEEARKGLALTIALYQSVEDRREVRYGMPCSRRLGR